MDSGLCNRWLDCCASYSDESTRFGARSPSCVSSLFSFKLPLVSYLASFPSSPQGVFFLVAIIKSSFGLISKWFILHKMTVPFRFGLSYWFNLRFLVTDL